MLLLVLLFSWSVQALLTSTSIIHGDVSIGIIISSNSVISVSAADQDIATGSSVASRSPTTTPAVLDATLSSTSSAPVTGLSSGAISTTSLTDARSTASTASTLATSPSVTSVVTSSTSSASTPASSSATKSSSSANTSDLPEASTPLSQASTSSAKAAVTTHDVQVGAFSQLSFEPSQINANVGDVIRFIFRSFNHTIKESSLDSPCTPLINGFNTGFNQYNPNGNENIQVLLTVTTSQPRYFFCEQSRPVSHCELGMVFAINSGSLYNDFVKNVLAAGPLTTLITAIPSLVTLSTSDGELITTTLSSVNLPKYVLTATTDTLPTVMLPKTSESMTGSSFVEKRKAQELSDLFRLLLI